MADIQPGELVVKRVRWRVDAHLIGVVIGRNQGTSDECSWLVMWTQDDQRVEFDWHLGNALLIVDGSNFDELRKRCDLRT